MKELKILFHKYSVVNLYPVLNSIKCFFETGLLCLFWNEGSLPLLSALLLQTQISRMSHLFLGWKKEFRRKNWWGSTPCYLSGRERSPLKGNWILLFVSAANILSPGKVPVHACTLLYTSVHLKLTPQFSEAGHCQVYNWKRRKILLI